ncbi:hypothetical protein [Pseudocnuella soli]|uniref:hypothetical protein n=1 Tax=Pseudocnuella soli TaxID=2502779 RepID=UPI0010463904|nr:hypothetical protein [Pseudocnuella soli]
MAKQFGLMLSMQHPACHAEHSEASELRKAHNCGQDRSFLRQDDKGKSSLFGQVVYPVNVLIFGTPKILTPDFFY